jgi:hypothetical protein
MKTRTKLGTAVVVLLALYISSYVALSVGGRFEPRAIGLNGVKGYAWAPRGFVKDYKWNWSLVLFYLPLTALDERVWHNGYRQYPVNFVKRENIWKVYKAWGLLDEEKPPEAKPNKPARPTGTP